MLAVDWTLKSTYTPAHITLHAVAWDRLSLVWLVSSLRLNDKHHQELACFFADTTCHPGGVISRHVFRFWEGWNETASERFKCSSPHV